MRFQIAVTPLGWGDVCGRAWGPRGSQKEKRGVQVVKKVGFGAGEQGGQGSSLSHLKNAPPLGELLESRNPESTGQWLRLKMPGSQLKGSSETSPWHSEVTAINQSRRILWAADC